MGLSGKFPLRQRLEQGVGLFEVYGVKPFGEPAVDVRQHPPGMFLLALLVPQTCQADRGPQL